MLPALDSGAKGADRRIDEMPQLCSALAVGRVDQAHRFGRAFIIRQHPHQLAAGQCGGEQVERRRHHAEPGDGGLELRLGTVDAQKAADLHRIGFCVASEPPFFDDHTARQACLRHNLKFFDAPYVAFLFMPKISDYVRAAGDIGMYAQTFLLSLQAHGLGGISQTLLGMYTDTVREVLGVSADLKLMFDISFGQADPHSASNGVEVSWVALEESVVRHR